MMVQTGPLPSAEELSKYEEVSPGLADRLVQRMEKQSDHRMQLESKALDADIRSRYLGQVLAAIIACTFLVGGCYFAVKGHPVEGATVAGGSVLGLVTVFITGKALQSKERNEKVKKLMGQDG